MMKMAKQLERWHYGMTLPIPLWKNIEPFIPTSALHHKTVSAEMEKSMESEKKNYFLISLLILKENIRSLLWQS